MAGRGLAGNSSCHGDRRGWDAGDFARSAGSCGGIRRQSLAASQIHYPPTLASEFAGCTYIAYDPCISSFRRGYCFEWWRHSDCTGERDLPSVLRSAQYKYGCGLCQLHPALIDGYFVVLSACCEDPGGGSRMTTIFEAQKTVVH